MMKKTFSQPLVIDCGSCLSKAGFGGDSAPRIMFPTVVGTAMNNQVSQLFNSDEFIGDEALLKRKALDMKYPINRSIIKDWDAIERIFHHIFYTALRVTPEEHPVLLTDSPFNNSQLRQRLVEIMFEKFQVPQVYISNQSVLSLYSAAKTSGLAVDIGSDTSDIVPVYEGYAIPDIASKLELGGSDITNYLQQLLAEQMVYKSGSNDIEILRDIKERLCYVADDYQKENQKDTHTLEETYELPDGTMITLGSCRYQCAEILFQPNLINQKTSGIIDIITNTISACDPDITNIMHSNIVVTGGSSMMSGMINRLQKELKQKLPSSQINITANDNRKYAAWLGGSILTSMPTFKQLWITREAYNNHGVDIVNTKCIL